MPKEHNVWEFATKLLNLVTKDIRAGKGAVLTGVVVAYLSGAVYGFPKDSATFFFIMIYVFLGCLALPAISLIFIKFDAIRAQSGRRRR